MPQKKHAPLSREELKVVAILTLLLFIGLMGTDIHLSSLPEMTKFMGTTQKLMQSSISIFLLGVGCSALVYGPLSDKYGRKPVIMIGISTAIAGNLWATTLSEIEPFLISRFVQGFGSGVSLALSRVVLSDIVQGERYAITSSYITMFTGLSIVFGPVIGSAIQSWYGWQTNFVVMAAMLFCILVIYALLCPETNRYKDQSIKLHECFANYRSVLRNDILLLATLLSGIGMACFVMYTSSSAFILQELFGMSPTDYGLMSAFVGAGLLVSRSLLPKLINNYGMHMVIATGLIILIVSGFSLLLLTESGYLSTTTFLISVSGVFFSYTFIVICASAISMTPFTDKRGAAGAVYSCSQMALAFMVNALVSVMSDNSVLIISTCYMALPIIGLYLCRKIQTKQLHSALGVKAQ
ncbi:multidrug effflux MFS transporter [Photobacterium sp. MCCC 1A19761]|uniref:multidrug effflux MFS transporter n=1 Tax=Photobacterium sp. MCCC 1A19761 TaxID=3115000 RepID=UPI00307D844E